MLRHPHDETVSLHSSCRLRGFIRCFSSRCCGDKTERGVYSHRRPGVERAGVLRADEDQDAAGGFAREGRDEVHASLCGKRGVRAFALRVDDGKAPGACDRAQ